MDLCAQLALLEVYLHGNSSDKSIVGPGHKMINFFAIDIPFCMLRRSSAVNMATFPGLTLCANGIIQDALLENRLKRASWKKASKLDSLDEDPLKDVSTSSCSGTLKAHTEQPSQLSRSPIP